jgi:hypothetical protein
MISLETARKLKEAGLKWEPQIGDYFAIADDGEELRESWEIASTNVYVISGEHQLIDELGGRMVFFGGGLCVRGTGCRMNETHCYCMNKKGFNPDIKVFSVASWEKKLFLPRLDQLLAEIEGRGYGWKLEKFHAYNLRRMQIYKINDLLGCFEADSPEEAAAQSLIWILEQKHPAE